MSYIGSPRRPFKNGLYEYRTSFPKPNKKNHTNCTQLANYLWKLCEKYTIKRKRVIQINSKFKPNFICSLCNLERLYIANANIRKSEIREMNQLHSVHITLGNILTSFLMYLIKYYHIYFVYFIYYFLISIFELYICFCLDLQAFH